MAETTKPKVEHVGTCLLSTNSTQSLHSKGAPQTERQTLWDGYRSTWFPEAIALTFSIVCAITTAVILTFYDGKPSPQMRLGLTLNALVSILSTASKVSLIYVISTSLGQLKWVWFLGDESRSLLDAEIYDDASRGPLGSLIMLWAPTRRSTATFGAVLTLLAVGYDPFVQQVITFQAVLRPGSVLNTTVVTSGAQYFTTMTSSASARVALGPAFWMDGSKWEQPCDSSACVWPIYESLAWRSHCFEDKNWTLSDDCNLKLTVRQVNNLPPGTQQITNCSLSAKNPFYQNSSHVWSKDLWLAHTPMFRSNRYDRQVDFSLSQVTTQPLYSMFYRNLPESWTWSPIASVGTFTLGFEDDWSAKLSVTTCELDLKLEKYELKVINGRTEANTLSSEPLQKRMFKRYINGSESTYELAAYLQPANSSNATLFKGWNMPSDSVLYEMDVDNQQRCGPPCQQHMALLSWSKAFDDIFRFHSNLSFSADWNPYLVNTTILTDSQRDMYFKNGKVTPGSDDKVFLWDLRGPARMMENVASSLTKLMMDSQQNQNGTYPIYGYATIPLTLVRVSWIWLVLPFGLCLAGTIFFLTTVYMSRQAGAPLWKSSINAFFYHGVDIDWSTWRPLTSIPEMEAEAEATRVKLVPVGLQKRLMLERQNWD